MKKLFTIAILAATIFPSCRKINAPADVTDGILSFAGLEIGCDVELISKAPVQAPGNYSIFIYNDKGEQVFKSTYSEVQKKDGISLLAGNYTLEARSTEEAIPASIFEAPVYGIEKEFSIEAGKTTTLGSIICSLLQCKVTVDYDQAFLEEVTGDSQTEVTVTAGYPLSYKLTYANGKTAYDKSAGYFAVNNGNKTTMSVVFKGNIQGKSQKMSAAITNIQPKQWRQVKFCKKVDEQGNATFQININNYVDDEELVVPLVAENEAVIGEDPKAPKGDGGITLAFAEGSPYTDLNNIVVPDPTVSPMDLKFVITVPNGVKKFVVDINSDNQDFISSVMLTGSLQLDLIDPMESQDLVFEIVPFPHGHELLGQTELLFDLSSAQAPLYAFSGNHTFTMMITDQKGCKNSVPVVLKVIK